MLNMDDEGDFLRYWEGVLRVIFLKVRLKEENELNPTSMAICRIVFCFSLGSVNFLAASLMRHWLINSDGVF